MPKSSPVKVNLTARTIRSIDPTSAETIWDNKVTGFGLRTRRSEDSSRWRWVFTYREGGRGGTQAKLSKPFAELTPDQARKWAEQERGRKGTSEGERAKRQRAEAAKRMERQTPTIQRLFDEYWESEGRLKKASHCYNQLWRDHLSPAFAKTRVPDLTPAMVERFKVSMRELPGACNRALALLSKMLSLAVRWGYRQGCAPEHPVKGVARYPERKSDFYFTLEELGRILKAADEDQNKVGGLAIRMLAVTSARSGEVTRAHWGQIEYCSEKDGGGAWWTVESTNTKVGRPVTRYLDADLAERLRQWQPLSLALQAGSNVVPLDEEARQPWLFPQQPDPSQPMKQLRHVWERVRKRAGVRKGRIHDLRHTGATHLVMATGSLEAAMIQCGHATPLTTRRYAHVVPEARKLNGMALASIVADAEGEASKAEAVNGSVIYIR